jgi:hypothetical protein
MPFVICAFPSFHLVGIRRNVSFFLLVQFRFIFLVIDLPSRSDLLAVAFPPSSGNRACSLRVASAPRPLPRGVPRSFLFDCHRHLVSIIPPFFEIADSSSQNAVSFSSACTTKRFPSLRGAYAIQIVRPLESTVDRNRAGSPLLFLAEFLESGIGAQRIPDRIEPKKGRRNGHRAVKPADIWRL